MSRSAHLFGHYRPVNVAARRKECARISALMSADRPFSFLRLGDMELMFLVACQNQHSVHWQNMAASESELVSSTIAFGHPGLGPQHAGRLQRAYERCSYLDFHDGWRVNAQHLQNWKHDRLPGLHRNPGPEVSQLFFDWLRYEFFGYVQERRCLFVGAEAGVLRELCSDPIYRQVASSYWPANANPVFFPETRRVGDCLDDIKRDVSAAIADNDVDTAFISLGGASKILCYELSEEHKITTFDFGSLMRGLTYSGSDGHNFFRTTHYPYYFRVPFDTYMGALQRAISGLSPEKLLAKAHAQLALELIRKEVAWSYASEWGGDDCLLLDQENRKHFWDAYSIYCRKYRVLGQHDRKAAEQILEFESWRRHLGLGLDGKVHRFSFTAKVAARKALALMLRPR
jgi:hypothetical protein